MRVLFTEIGNASSGDEAICIAATRRFIAMGAEVTFCHRVNLENSIRKAGLRANHAPMPIEEEFDGISAVDDLLVAAAERLPAWEGKMRDLLSSHDVVAVVPGCKYTAGYKTARSLLTSAMAESMGIPVILLHHSVGPIDNPRHRTLLAEVLGRCRLALIRDDRSIIFLRELGIPEQKLIRCRDAVMGEVYPPAAGPEYDLGVNIRYGWNGHATLDALSRFLLRYKTARPNARVLVYSTTFNLPAELTTHLSSLACDVQVEMLRYPDYVREVGRCAVNVSDSWHGIIFSMMANRPTVCCQPDFRTWKLDGLHPPGETPLEVLPGLVSPEEADVVLDRVLAVERDPGPVLQRQRRIMEYGRDLCEHGWTTLTEALSSPMPAQRFLTGELGGMGWR